MCELKKLRNHNGISEWYETKGAYHHANWELNLPRDNGDITSVISADELTEPERALDELERLGIDIPGNSKNEKLIDGLTRAQEESDKEYRAWANQISKVIKTTMKKWPMPKRFTYYCLASRYKEVTFLELKELVNACFPLQRDRKAVIARALNLCLSNSRKSRLRLTQKVIAELVDRRSSNQISNYKRQIREELGESLKELSEDPARRAWPQ